MFYYLLTCFFMDWAAWFAVSGWKNIKNRDQIKNKTMRLETVIYLVVPFDYEYNFYNWIIYHSVGGYLAMVGGLVIVVLNALSFMFVYHLIGHINILKHKLKTNFVDDYGDEEVRKKLADVIAYHSFIMR